MQDHVRNFISVFGNDAVQATHREVIRRLRDFHKINYATAIGEVLYGLPTEMAKLGRDKITADWARYAIDYEDDDLLSIDSGGRPPNQLLNHIIWFYSKVDPDCVLHNGYDHINAEFIGGSFKIVRNSKIFNFEKFKNIDAFVCFESSLEEMLEEGGDVITWENFFDAKHDINLEARSLLIDEYPFVKKYFNL